MAVDMQGALVMLACSFIEGINLLAYSKCLVFLGKSISTGWTAKETKSGNCIVINWNLNQNENHSKTDQGKCWKS